MSGGGLTIFNSEGMEAEHFEIFKGKGGGGGGGGMLIQPVLGYAYFL